MKPDYLPPLLAMALSTVFFATTGCSGNEKTPDAPLPKATDAETRTAVPSASTAVADIAAASWADIKDDTYDQRVHFSAGLKLLQAKVDGQIAELVAKRAAMKGTTRTEEWDFAMKEMNNSRDYLRSVAEELSQATTETWNQRKEKVGKAWVRTQDAYGKVKASTTS